MYRNLWFSLLSFGLRRCAISIWENMGKHIIRNQNLLEAFYYSFVENCLCFFFFFSEKTNNFSSIMSLFLSFFPLIHVISWFGAIVLNSRKDIVFLQSTVLIRENILWLDQWAEVNCISVKRPSAGSCISVTTTPCITTCLG